MTSTGIPEATSYCDGRSCADEIGRTLLLLTGRWAVPVLEALHFSSGPARFRALQRHIGTISQKELARQLTLFVHHGVVLRHADPLHVQRVAYELTPRGHALLAQMDLLGQWAQRRA